MLRKLRYYGGTFVRAKLRRLSRGFLATTADCRATQREVLRHLLELNEGSRFSRDHRLDGVRAVNEFRRSVPIADFEYYRSYVEQLKLGNSEALLGRKNRLLMFTLSSGTTSESKFIPITDDFLRSYRKGWSIWGINTFTDHPSLSTSHIVQLSSDHEQFHTPGGTPCGNISGLVGAVQSPLVRSMYTVPLAVAKIKDPEAKYYTALRLCVADRDVGLVMTANPSTLIHLAKMADSEKEKLIRDIANGTLSDEYSVPAEIRDRLRRRVRRADPKRARELEGIIHRTGHLYPRDFWPELELLGIWTGGSAGAYLHSLPRFYGDVDVRDHGLSASEGRMTIPFQDWRSDGVLDVTSHYFEFIPEGEHGTEHPTVLEAHELEEGRNYYILLTTASGLSRYDIRDVVRCTGFVGTTPTLEFLHKGSHISSITGEKLSESQVVGAVRECIGQMRLELNHFTLAPVWGDPPSYRLLVEEQSVPSFEAGRALAGAVDASLQSLNCEYEEKRRTGRLAPIEWLRLPTGSFKRFASKRQSKLGGSIEQYKHPCLVPDLEFCERFLSEFASPQAAPSRTGVLRPHMEPRTDRRTPARTVSVQRERVSD